MARILKFNKEKADENRMRIKKEIKDTEDKLARLVEHTIAWYSMLKDKYGQQFPRRTEIRNFDTIEAAKVVEANEKLYINREEDPSYLPVFPFMNAYLYKCVFFIPH